MYRCLRYITGCCVLVVLLSACALVGKPDNDTPPLFTLNTTPPPTPASEVLHTLGIAAEGARLRVTVPAVDLETTLRPDARVQVLVVLADPRGKYAYVFAPANPIITENNRFDLSNYALEISLRDNTDTTTLWFLAVDNRDPQAATLFGTQALAASLGYGFQNWLSNGDATDDPLAAIVAASEGTLYDWFASIEVLGQNVVTLSKEDWNTSVTSRRSPDEGLNAVYTTRFIAEETANIPSPTAVNPFPGYTLRAEETFDQANNVFEWYQGQDGTYVNQIIGGAYQIHLSKIVEREFGQSWGSIENEQFSDYIVQAEMQLVEEDVKEARYGIWFNYQDDYNFMYFGVSNQGQYRAAVIVRNSNRIELQDWTPHPVIRRGTATNTLTIQSSSDGDMTLSINGTEVATFNDQTFTSGSIAFFCYAESVPATCRLDRLRIWERAN